MQDKHQWLWPFLLYLFTGFQYVFLIWLNYRQQANVPSDFFQQIFVFRNGHHYLPSEYPLRSWILFFSCFGLAFWQFTALRNWLLILLLGSTIYLIGVSVFHSTTIASAQWFKTAIWVKPLGFAAGLQLLNQRFHLFNQSWRLPFERSFVLFTIGSLSILLLLGRTFIPFQVPFDYGEPIAQFDKFHDINLKAHTNSDKEAVFIVPIANTKFNFVAQRALYVSYKANPKKASLSNEWCQRVLDVYGLDYNQAKQANQDIANQWYDQLSVKQLLELAGKGVTHAIVKTSVTLPSEWIIAQNQDWQIIEIPSI